MIYVCYALFGLAVAAYVVALANTTNSTGELGSDVGNGLMLTAAVLLLFRLSRSSEKQG